jgi:cytochrome subunit of sulfide dehydrogenase
MRVCTAWIIVLAGLLLTPTDGDALEAPGIVPFCALCHGETGPSPYIGVPTIHGLPPNVIENALYKYREGLRPCRTSECSEQGSCPDITMCDIVGSMTDAEFDELAHWYGSQPFPPHKDPYDPELAARGRILHDQYCEICHTNFGSDPIDDASMLRGQRKVYLRIAMGDFQQGRRSTGIAAMDERVRSLSDADLDALAEFFSGPATYLLLDD